MHDPNTIEAERRINEAAMLLASAIRLGGRGDYARSAMSAAVREGAEQLAQDTIEEFEERKR